MGGVATVKGFCTVNDQKAIQNQIPNESGLFLAALTHVASCDFATGLVLGMQHAQSALHGPSHHVVPMSSV